MKRFNKPKCASPINALRNGMIRGYFGEEGVRYIATYEEFFPGEYVLFKIENNSKKIVYRSTKDADDVMNYLLNLARSQMDKAKSLRDFKESKMFLENTIKALIEYESCRRSTAR